MAEQSKNERDLIEDAIKSLTILVKNLIEKKKVYGSRTEREDEAIVVANYLIISLLMIKDDINGSQNLSPLEKDRYYIFKAANELELNKKLAQLKKEEKDLDIEFLTKVIREQK